MLMLLLPVPLPGVEKLTDVTASTLMTSPGAGVPDLQLRAFDQCERLRPGGNPTAEARCLRQARVRSHAGPVQARRSPCIIHLPKGCRGPGGDPASAFRCTPGRSAAMCSRSPARPQRVRPSHSRLWELKQPILNFRAVVIPTTTCSRLPRSTAPSTPKSLQVSTYFVRLRHGAQDLPRFQTEARRHGALSVTDLDTTTMSNESSIHPQALGWWLLAGVMAFVGIILIIQALTRQAIIESDAYATNFGSGGISASADPVGSLEIPDDRRDRGCRRRRVGTGAVAAHSCGRSEDRGAVDRFRI